MEMLLNSYVQNSFPFLKVNCSVSITSLFKDWYVRWIIRAAAGWILGLYSQAYVEANTVYIHEEDKELLKGKYDALYGPKSKDDLIKK